MGMPTKFLGMTRLEAVTLVASAAIIAAIIGPALRQLDGRGGLPRRAICSANIRGIIQAMYIYGQSNNGCFPSVAPAGAAFVNGLDPRGAPTALGTVDPQSGLLTHETNGGKAAGALAGSPLAGLWLLVIDGGITPMSFICPADPSAVQPSVLFENTSQRKARYYLNFGMGGNGRMPEGQGESYSVAFPWIKGKPAPWWNVNLSENDQSYTPLVCDMAPMQDPQAPGKDARDVTQPLHNKFGDYIFNSGNHDGMGQNVGYGDDHVAWATDPYVGVQQDNIFTSGQTGTHGGGVPIAPRLHAPSPQLSAEYPFDIVMVPTRNVRTGRW